MSTIASLDVPAAPSESPSAAVRPLSRLIEELRDAIALFDDAAYAAKPVAGMTSSIGEHVRHCLDHIESLIAAWDAECIDYDARERGTPVEHNRAAAGAAIARLLDRLRSLPTARLERPIRVRAQLDPDGPPLALPTSLLRELAFVFSHTVHHAAMISVMGRAQGFPLPEKFGVAPATIAYLRAAPASRAG